jgi:hypothetical protein
MLSTDQIREVRKVARNHGNHAWGTMLLLSADGPEGIRGFIPVQDYRPEYKPGQFRPLAEHRKKHPRELRERDIFEEYGEYVRNHH